MVEIAGGEYVPSEPSKTVSFEEVIHLNPEIIILSWCGAGAKSNPKLVATRPGWDHIDAVRNNKIYPLPDQFFNSPCQHLITGLKLMSQILHPEIFGSYCQEKESLAVAEKG